MRATRSLLSFRNRRLQTTEVERESMNQGLVCQQIFRSVHHHDCDGTWPAMLMRENAGSYR